MSLLWRDRLVLAIYPDRVAWLRAVRRWPTRVTDKGVVSCAVDSGEPWRQLYRYYARNPAHGKGRGAESHGAAFQSTVEVRCCAQPGQCPQPGRARPAGAPFLRAHARRRCCWMEYQAQRCRPRPCRAGRSPLDRQLVVSLGEAVAAASARLTSIQPYLMAAFNRHHRMFAERDGVSFWPNRNG